MCTSHTYRHTCECVCVFYVCCVHVYECNFVCVCALHMSAMRCVSDVTLVSLVGAKLKDLYQKQDTF